MGALSWVIIIVLSGIIIFSGCICFYFLLRLTKHKLRFKKKKNGIYFLIISFANFAIWISFLVFFILYWGYKL